jgi:hypothetical protein
MKKYRIVGLPQAPTYRTDGVLDQFAPGGAPCPRGQIRDASGKCVNYNWGSGNIQAADSYAGMYGGYDRSGVKNLKQVSATAKKGKKFSDYILRGGKSRADVARNIGKNAGQYFGMSGEALEPVNYTKAGLDKFTTDVKNAKKNFEADEKNYQNYLKSKEKASKGKMDTSKYARQYDEKGWAEYDQNTKEGRGPDAEYSAKEARQNWGDPEEWKKFNKLVGNAAMGIAGIGAAGAMGGAGAALLENPVVQGGLTAYGAYDATTNAIPEAYKDFSEGRYWEGLGNTAMAGLDLVPGVGLAGKGAKLGYKGLKGAVNYGNDVIQTSKQAGKFALPKYKNVYRVEHAGFDKVANPDKLTGRWFADNPIETKFYARNLKDPVTGEVIRDVDAPTRVMQQRLPEYKVQQNFGAGMPEDARMMSIGKGDLTDAEFDELLGEGASNRINMGGDYLTESDINSVTTAPFLFRKEEGILDADIVNKIRGNTNAGRFSSGKSTVFENQDKAVEYLFDEGSRNFNPKSKFSKYIPFKEGGSIDDYIELDIPEDKIQNYLNNGYNVEEVAVPMMADGGTPSAIWYQYTGTPWSEAKTKGLTDGSAEQNLALAKRLQAGEFGEPKIVDAKPTPTVTPYDQMVFALVKQGNTIDDLVKQRVGTKEGLIFKYPELFANKKNVSAPKKPGKKPGKGTTIMEQFDALSKFISPYADEIGDAVSTAYDSWITRMSKISEQEKKAKKKPAAPAIDLNKIFTNKIEEYKKFGKPIVEQKPVVQQKQVIQPYDIEALRAQLTQSNMVGAPPSLTRQQPQQPLGNNSAAQFAEYGRRGQGIENTSLNLQPDPEVSLWDVMNKVNKDLSSKTTVEEKPPVFDNSISSQLIEQEWLGRQQKDNERYGKFMSRGKDIANRTDVQRNVDSEKFFADIAKPNSVIIDIGSALGNSDPKLAGVSVWELTQNPKIKQKKIKVIATDIPEQVSTFKKHAKDKKAYNIDYAEVPMTYNTPIDNILKTKNLSNTKDIYLRAANSIDLLMTVAQTKEHFYNIAKKLKAKNVTYVYNNMIWYKPSGETSWRKLGNINNAAYDHNAASWKLDKNRKPYALTGDDVRNPFNN